MIGIAVIEVSENVGFVAKVEAPLNHQLCTDAPERITEDMDIDMARPIARQVAKDRGLPFIDSTIESNSYLPPL